MKARLLCCLLIGAAVLSSHPLLSVARADSGGGHEDPIAGALLALAVILVAARLGAHVATRLGQAAVLGELIAGVVLGNVVLLGVGDLGWMAKDSTIDALARLGVILLLFEVGLESQSRR